VTRSVRSCTYHAALQFLLVMEHARLHDALGAGENRGDLVVGELLKKRQVRHFTLASTLCVENENTFTMAGV